MENKIIFFSKIPKYGYGKTRLKSLLSEEQRYDLCNLLIKENLDIIIKSNIDFCVHYSGIGNLFDDFEKKEQVGSNLGQKMFNAIKEELNYSKKVILVGSDLRGIDEDILYNAFDMLEDNDIVLAPTLDGGYGIVGMKEAIDIFSKVIYSTPNVFSDTIKIIKSKGKKVGVLRTVRDIDTVQDLISEEVGSNNIQLIGKGEYNINFRFDDKYVFRINMKSQLGLDDRQIEYEYNALKLLEKTGVTPKVYRYDIKGKYIKKGYLIMDFLEGNPLDYDKDMDIVAYMLAKVHSCDITNHNLIVAKKPFLAMMEECKNMFFIYKNYELKSHVTEQYIEKFIKIVTNLGINDEIKNPCIINTELNNRNFIIGKKSYIIDWEKPIIGEREQDLAHFLVPTTTNWKTDKILSDDEILNFIKEYKKYNSIDEKKLRKYFVFNILRGITGCSMAKVEYEKNEKGIVNQDTYEKINTFLSENYLKMLYERFYGVLDEK